MKQLKTITAVTASILIVSAVSGAAVYKHHLHTTKVASKEQTLTVQLTQTKQALANEEDINKNLNSNNAALSAQVTSTKSKLVTVCSKPANIHEVTCKP